MKKKSQKKFGLLLIFLILFGLLMGVFYWSTHSQEGLKVTWAKLLYLIPGRFEWDRMDIDFTGRTLQIKNLSYTHPSGFKILTAERVRAKLYISSLFRLRSMFENLEAEGVTVDLSSLPPRKNPGPISPVLQALSKRLAVDQSQLKNITLLLKNGFFKIPFATFRFQPTFLGKDEMKFQLNSLEGEFAERPLSAESIGYEGSFAAPDIIRDTFLFREATGKFTMQGAQFGRWKLSDLSTEAGFDGETIDFKGINLTIGKANYLIKLKLSPFDQRYEGNLATVTPVPSEEMPNLSPKLTRAFETIAFSLDFKMAGFLLREMEGNFSLNLKAMTNRINPKNPNYNLKVAAKIQKGQFDFTQFDIQSEKTRMTGKGWVDFAKSEIGVSLGSNGFDLRTFISLFSDVEIYGYGDFTGTIKGELKNPDFRFNGKAHETGYKFLRFGENEGTFEILNGQMRYNGRSPAGAAYSDTIDIVTANLFKKETRSHVLKTTFNNLDVTSLLENPGMTGKVSGTWDMQVKQSQNLGKLTATIKDFHLYQFHIGDMTIEGTLNNNVFTLPVITFQPPHFEKLKIAREAVFRFNKEGFKFTGSPLEGMEVEGGYLYNRKNVLDTKARCNRCRVAPFLAVLEKQPYKGFVNGTMTMQLIIGNFAASKLDSQIDRLEVPLGEGALTQSGMIRIGYRQGAFRFDQVNLAFDQGVFRLDGSFDTDGPLDLGVTGSLDLGILKAFREYFREGNGLAKVNLKVRGKMPDPQITGTLDFNQAMVSLRALPNVIENLKGQITLDSEKISTTKLEGSISEGDLLLSGTIWHDHFKIKKADLKADVREIAYSEPGVYKLILSGNLKLTGEHPHLLLAGNLDITEGRYVKNFDIREFVAKPSANLVAIDRGASFDNLQLDLQIRSPGELLVKNNVAEIYLKSDLRITGTKVKPVYEGAVEVLDGAIHYFKLNFENAKGYIDFRNPQKGHPYVDITGQKVFERSTEDILVAVHVQGYTDNLQLSFASDPPLEKRDILALVFTGSTPEDRQKISGGSIASSVLASQLTSVLEKPVSGLTHLDIFRLEASDPEAKSLTSLVVGKKITERLSLEFKTDLSLEEAVKSVQAEYQIIDNVLFKASRASTGRYRLELTFRFKGY